MDYKNIILEASDGNKYALTDFKKKIVLYFYPKYNTPGCTTEAIDFTSHKEDFDALDTIVIGVSRDSIKSHLKFIEKQELKLLLLSDEEELLCRAFDVIKEKNMYGKKVMGIERSTFILDENTNIVAEFRKVRAAGHVDVVLEKVKELA